MTSKEVMLSFKPYLEKNDYTGFFKHRKELIDIGDPIISDAVFKFTEMVVNSGIEPLKHTDIIPRDYLLGAKLTNTNIVIPEGIITILPSAYYYSNIESVVIPASCREVGSMAFFLCKDLKNVIINSTDITIKRTTFQNTPSLETVKIPKGCNINIFLFNKNVNIVEV